MRDQERLIAILATRASTPSIQRVPLANLIIATVVSRLIGLTIVRERG